jgi:hypothetical protein
VTNARKLVELEANWVHLAEDGRTTRITVARASSTAGFGTGW